MKKLALGGLRITRRLLVSAAVLLLLAMALVAVAASQLLPMLERNPARVEAWLGERAGHPVQFDALETEWTRRGPLLRLDGLRIGAGADAVSVGAAEVLVAQYAGLLPGRSLTELRLRDLELVLARGDDGRWHVRGLPGQDGGRDPFTALERLGELQVIGASLDVDAPGLGLQVSIPRIDVRLRVDGSRVRAASRAWKDPAGAALRAVALSTATPGTGACTPAWKMAISPAGRSCCRSPGWPSPRAAAGPRPGPDCAVRGSRMSPRVLTCTRCRCGARRTQADPRRWQPGTGSPAASIGAAKMPVGALMCRICSPRPAIMRNALPA